MRRLALFDFDGTVSHKDSFLEFIKFTHGRARFFAGFLLLSPVIVLFKLGLLPNWRTKQIAFSFFYKGMEEQWFLEKAGLFSKSEIAKIVRPTAMKSINKHKVNGDRIIIVSATFEPLLCDFCKENDIELLATKVEIKNGKVTGKLGSPNCYGPEKVVRIEAHLQLADFHQIIAYGDSRGDKEMLALANEGFYKPFR